MDAILYLGREDVSTLLPGADEQIDLVERTYGALAAGRVELPPKPGVHPRKDSFIHAMPAYLADEDVAAIKWVSGYPGNKANGLPYISGLVVLNDAATGLPLAIMDGAEITAARTAAASGVCIRHFAPEGWSTAAVLGCGEQGRFHARLIAALNPDVTIRAYDPHPERVASLGVPVDGAADEREAVAGAEVIVTAAPIVENPVPKIGLAELGERWLLLPIDFDALVARDAVEAAETLLVDDAEQFDYYRGLGHFDGWPEPQGNVGGALGDGTVAGSARVACVNLGIGALDAAFAKVVHDRARERGAGVPLAR